MAWSETLRGLLRSALGNPQVQKAGVEVISGIGAHLVQNAGDPERVRRLGQTLVDHAPAVIGAIVKDTPAEPHVDPAAVKAAEAAAAGPMPGHG